MSVLVAWTRTAMSGPARYKTQPQKRSQPRSRRVSAPIGGSQLSIRMDYGFLPCRKQFVPSLSWARPQRLNTAKLPCVLLGQQTAKQRLQRSIDSDPTQEGSPMKGISAPLIFLAAATLAARAADSVVVFNEVHYHPATNEAVSEWVELHNQMAIDIDLSAWRITGDIAFTFAEGTIITGGGYLVVASEPNALRTLAGITNLVGPFTGRLNNGNGTLRLRDRNDRLMDELDYRDGGKWPVAPDGSGVTLAKRDRNTPSAAPENWTSSVRAGGTPGALNFPEPLVPLRRALVPLTSLWRFESS